jgi:hypothetical protein
MSFRCMRRLFLLDPRFRGRWQHLRTGGRSGRLGGCAFIRLSLTGAPATDHEKTAAAASSATATALAKAL